MCDACARLACSRGSTTATHQGGGNALAGCGPEKEVGGELSDGRQRLRCMCPPTVCPVCRTMYRSLYEDLKRGL